MKYLKLHDLKHPDCATDKQYFRWRGDGSSSPGKAGFCEDCTPDYQREMICSGKCNHPEVFFKLDFDGFICGTYQNE